MNTGVPASYWLLIPFQFIHTLMPSRFTVLASRKAKSTMEGMNWKWNHARRIREIGVPWRGVCFNSSDPLFKFARGRRRLAALAAWFRVA
jgi:hypothetical protein